MINTVFQLVETNIQYETTGANGSVDIFTDLDGNWATATNVALPATSNGPATLRKELGNKLGTSVTVRFNSGSGTSVLPREMSIKMRRIGLYLGANQSWSTGRIPINI
jgi:hypothetical protein